MYIKIIGMFDIMYTLDNLDTDENSGVATISELFLYYTTLN